jgi:hypothetical protein
MMHMSIESLGSMFSQRSRVQQSMGNSVMNVIVGFLAQKMVGQGIGSMLSGVGGGSGSGSSGINSVLSGIGGLNHDHELVRHVQQNAGIQDPEQARQYTQHGVDVLNEQSNNNPQGVQSIFASFLGRGARQQEQNSGSGGAGGLLGDILGS